MKNAEDFLKECKKNKNFRMSTDTVLDQTLIDFANGYADYKLKSNDIQPVNISVVKCPECLYTTDQEELDMFGGLCETCTNEC